MELRMVVVVVTHLVVPWSLIARLWRGSFRSKISWLVSTAALGAYVAGMVMIGAWAWVSYYFRIALPLAFLGAAYCSFRRVLPRQVPWWRRPESASGWAELVTDALVAAVFGWLAVGAVQGLGHGNARAVELSFPLKGGVYYVGQGGGSPMLNHHSVDKAQRFALDIVKLNAAGTRAAGLYPSDPARYAVFGEPIYSPCAGEVVASKDGLPDNKPPDSDRKNLAGNHVVVRCAEQGVDVGLAHMMNGSVAVKPGQQVEVGQLLGRVGNSGNTREPHLHIHAVKTGSGSVSDGEGVPIRFDGRFLVRNSLVMR